MLRSRTRSTSQAAAVRRVAALALAGALIMAAAGCGTEMIDREDLEQSLSAQVEEQTGVAPEVSCPDEIEAEEGRELTCEATTPEGDPADLRVTLTDDEGAYRVDFNRADFQNLFTGEVLADAIGEQFESQLPFAFTIDCPQEILAEEGAELECELETADGETAPVEVVLTDDEGGFRANLGEQAEAEDEAEEVERERE